MANLKITDLTAYTTPDGVNDVIEIVDVGNNISKKITRNNYLGITGAPVGTTDSQTLTNKTLTSPTISGPTLSGTVGGTYTLGGTPTFPAAVVTLTGSQTLTNKTLTSPAITGGTLDNTTVTVDTIAGHTTSNTGTVYGVSITSGTISTAGLANASVTASKLATGATVSTVATSEATASTTYVALATAQSFSVTIGANGLALVILTANITNSSTTRSYMSYDMSGANTFSAADTKALIYQPFAAGAFELQSAVFLLTGLSAGSTTFTAKYKASANTATFQDRNMTVIPL